MSLYRSKSQNMIKTNKKTPKFLKIKQFTSLSPKMIHPKINNLLNKTNSILNNQNNSLSSRKKKFTNHFIFMKREILFNKSLEENNKTFKYSNYALSNKKKKILCLHNKKEVFRKKVLDKKSSSPSPLFLTENVNRPFKTMYPFMNLSQSSTIGFDINKIENITNIENQNGLYINQNKKNEIFNDYISFGKKIKNNNLKQTANNTLLLKTFDVNKIREIELKNQTLDLKKRNANLFNKTKVLDNCQKVELSRLNYVNNIRDYIKHKTKSKEAKEEEKRMKENHINELIKINNNMARTQQYYDSFKNNFLNKFDKYIKQLYYNITLEKKKDEELICLRNSLKVKNTNINFNITKCKNTLEELYRYIYLFICVKEKKKVLPHYYKIILETRFYKQREQLKKISKEEIQRVQKYKTSILELGPDYMLGLIKKYENDNIILINELNNLRNEIIILRFEKENFMKQIKKYYISDEIFESKEKELLNLKELNHKLNEKILKIEIKKEDDNFDINTNKLYSKINSIINKIKGEIKYDFVENNLIIRNNKTNVLILCELTKLEILANIILSRIKEFKKKYPSKIPMYKMLVERYQKRRNINQQKKFNKMKIIKNIKRIIEKNEKNVIIPTKKIDRFNIVEEKMNFRKKTVKIKTKEDTIDDYLSDEENS